ncbi:alpha-amylase family glycosyl hydrolase [Thalassotalea sp. PLHSN55]|uniref:alpha-amylase family glycosyl hydrolase n=1 Tax=Thalassotalea sp. PLHSN55 TaxID=3435888 RepID=UPI003F856891
MTTTIKTISTFATSLLAGVLLSACHPAETVSSAPAVAQEKTRANASDLPHYLTRDIQDEIFYFVMPDRFYNGDESNDNGSTTEPLSAGGFDPTHKGYYHGGDLNGLQQKLPYLKELGITSIWMTPIMRNQAVQANSAGYHGYWILDFTEIDPHLGSNAELKAFIDAAHKENIKIFFDIITNHTADVIKYPACHGEDGLQWLMEQGSDCPYKTIAETEAGQGYQAIIPKGQENVKTPAWLNDPKYYHNQGDSFWEGESAVYGDFSGLDDVNTDDPFVVKGMTDIFKNVISEFKPDGFRIDTVKHVNMEFWQEFAPALVEHAKSEGIPQFFMFGEVYDPSSAFLSQFTTVGKMQSVLDFGFQSAAQQALVDQKGTNVLAELFANDKDYLDEDSSADQLVTFVGNHDMGRFAHMLQTSAHNYSESEQAQRTLLAHALMYFSRGIPVIYYGAEQGFVGEGGDQASRQDMMPSKVKSYNDNYLLATDKTTADDNFDTSHSFYKTFADFADVYIKNHALRYGKTETLYAQDSAGMFAFSRTSEQQNIVVVLNTATTEQKVELDVNAKAITSLYQSENSQQNAQLQQNKLAVTLPALSIAVYQID